MKHIKAAVIVAGILGLSACVVPGPYYGGGYGYGSGPDVVVDTPPPPPQYEAVPPVPYVGAVWIGGFWDWRGGRHVWVPGRYDHGRPGYIYHQAGWSRDGGGRYHFRRGGWDRH